MTEEQKGSEYIKDYKEWTDKMYSPGHYLGGNFPFSVKHPRRIFVGLTGVMLFISAAAYGIMVWSSGELADNWIAVFWVVFFVVAGIGAFIRLSKMKK